MGSRVRITTRGMWVDENRLLNDLHAAASSAVAKVCLFVVVSNLIGAVPFVEVWVAVLNDLHAAASSAGLLQPYCASLPVHRHLPCRSHFASGCYVEHCVAAVVLDQGSTLTNGD